MTTRISIANHVFPLKLGDNPTARDFADKMPLQLRVVRTFNNEFTCTLPVPLIDDSTGVTSRLNEGSVYYFGLWNAFVMVLKNVNISPYSVVHIGDIEGDIKPLFANERIMAVGIDKD